MLVLLEKCVWSRKNLTIFFCAISSSVGPNEPESWYQGITHFSDQIWRFDSENPFTDLLADPKDFNVSIDATNLELSPNEDYLFFINKDDLSLWALKLQ